MSSPALELSSFAADVLSGLSTKSGKHIPPKYFYDDLGSVLFEAITLLPEYGLTRADEKLLLDHSSEIVERIGAVSTVAELGSGSGRKTTHVLRAFSAQQSSVQYCPIDVSAGALDACERQINPLADVHPVVADWMDGLRQIARERDGAKPLLLLFLGSSVGNLDRAGIPDFLRAVRKQLRAGDYFLLGMDLVKGIDQMINAYDDPTGVTAAFNLNLLSRINHELDADFDLRSFAHEARWNESAQRIEMHLRSGRHQDVFIKHLDARFHFEAGETIWTESSHKFTVEEIHSYAGSCGFQSVATWIDKQWPFAEVLWRAEGDGASR